ncbi:hypothetical protein Pth03_08240 [Planotetraspora thailandica]|uniref:Uncharacterized protein n=1 Tax=Planotetraspora thailandica TaxID=487172 RepID=A0A8J3UXG7_9ACTN|nr:hypothetical protein [Planotetraspora thailandica]GII52435.1 hypothetical protein Pth03_08240 [Planotetraspora thailandica]
MPAARAQRNAMTTARIVALALVAVMAVYFITSDAIRSGNPFLVPDALLTALLAVSAAFRGRLAVPVMIFSFAWAAAVWTVSLCTYITRGAFEDGANHLALIIPSVGVAGLLAVVSAASDRANEAERV